MSLRRHEGSRKARGYGVLTFVVTFCVSAALVHDAIFGLVCASIFAIVVFEWLAISEKRRDSDGKPEIATGEESRIE